jgi:subtilase family serine protease
MKVMKLFIYWAIIILFLTSFIGATAAGSVATQPHSTNMVLINGYDKLGTFVKYMPDNINLSFVVALNLRNEIMLQNILSNHIKISRNAFINNISPTLNVTNVVEGYFRGYGLNLYTYSDRLNLFVSGPVMGVNRALSTDMAYYMINKGIYYHPASSIYLPRTIAIYISSITGLNSYNDTLHISSLYYHHINIPSNAGKYFYTQNGNQYFYGSAFQFAFGADKIFSKNIYPVNQTIINLMWQGVNSNDTPVGPYYPPDITNYINATYPPNEPLPTIHYIGVPYNGIPIVNPGSSALQEMSPQYARSENTVDLDMLATNSPGANIYDVYASTNTLAAMINALEYALNDKALTNVSVISNSWGTSDTFSTSWNNLIMEANSRSITVLAASGDSGNNAVMFPATDANNTYGVVAVGGVTITISGTPSSPGYVNYATVWINSNIGKVIGTTAGISNVYSEPSWQVNSIANKLINGKGRGVADISSVANNTIIYMYPYNNVIMEGTSVATPVTASQISVIDAYRHNFLGFFLPELYKLGDNASTYTNPPFFSVYNGSTLNYSAQPGWSFPTGFGIIYPYYFSIDMSGLSVIVTPNRDGGTQLPLNVSFNIHTYDGIAPYNYTIYFGNASRTMFTDLNNNSLRVYHIFNKKGIYPVTVNVTDSKDKSGNMTIYIYAGYPLFANLSVNVYSQNIVASYIASVTIEPHSGVLPYTITWSFSDGQSGTVITNGTVIASNHYMLPGSYQFSVTVTDSNNGTFSKNITINIVSNYTSTISNDLSPISKLFFDLNIYTIILYLIAIPAAVIAVIYRKTKPPEHRIHVTYK